MIRNAWRNIWPYVLLAVAAAAFPLVARNNYLQFVGAMVGLYALIALGLCLLMGYAGQVSLGHAAFYAVGAYSSAILCVRYHANPWLGMLGGVGIASLIALVVGRPTLRLRGHYLAMATLGFGIIVQILFEKGGDLTGGFDGIASIPPLAIGGLVFKGDTANFYLIWFFVIAALLVSANIVHSRVGRAMRAIHDSEVAAQACGVDVARYKMKVFILSAAFASVAGSLYAHYISFISPHPFGLQLSVLLVVMVIVGGSRSVWGALLGATLMTVVGRQIEDVEAIKDLSIVVYGGVLILFVIFMPQGLADVLRRGGQAILRLRGRVASG